MQEIGITTPSNSFLCIECGTLYYNKNTVRYACKKKLVRICYSCRHGKGHTVTFSITQSLVENTLDAPPCII